MDPTYYGLGAPKNYRAPGKGVNVKLIVFIVLGVMALAVAWWLLSNGSNTSSLPHQMLYRLGGVQSLLSDGQLNSRNDGLKKLTAETSIVLLGHSTTLKRLYPLPAKPDKKLQSIIAGESVAPILKTMTDSKINGAHESTYHKSLLQKLNETYALAAELEWKTTRAAQAQYTSLKQDILQNYQQLQAIQP